MNVIFTCGGTGGHINPAIAVANIWKERYPDSNILFVGAKDRMDTYNDGDVYLIGFKENIIELQRFNKGVRTMVFGDAEFMPIGGPGVPNSGGVYYKPGETYSVIAGLLEDENGTRIVLTINGVNVFDYTDTSADRVSANGYFGIYESSGSFEFSPYTGMMK